MAIEIHPGHFFLPSLITSSCSVPADFSPLRNSWDKGIFYGSALHQREYLDVLCFNTHTRNHDVRVREVS